MALGGGILLALSVFLPTIPAGNWVGQVSALAAYGALLASGAAVLLRWRRSRGQERQQIKLLVYTVAITAVAVLGALTIWYARDHVWGAPSYPDVLATLVGLAGLAVGIPIAIGVAVLRHRLYNIDLVINRTLVYGALTVSLGLVYFGGITTTQAIVQEVTSQEEPPQLAIVVGYPSDRRAVYSSQTTHPALHR